MLPARRAWSLALAAGFIAVWVSAPAQSTDIAKQKQEILRAALAKNGSGEPAPKLLEAAEKSAAILSADLQGDPKSPVLTITLDGAPEFDWFFLDKGKRLVVDFYDSLYFQSGKELSAASESTYLKSVRSSIYAMEPRFVARFVMDLKKEAKPVIELAAGKVQIGLAAKTSKDKTTRSKRIKTEPSIVLAQQPAPEAKPSPTPLTVLADELARLGKEKAASDSTLTNSDAGSEAPLKLVETQKTAATGPIQAVAPAAVDTAPAAVQAPSAVVVASGEPQSQAKTGDDPFANMRRMLQQLADERQKTASQPAPQSEPAPAPAEVALTPSGPVLTGSKKNAAEPEKATEPQPVSAPQIPAAAPVVTMTTGPDASAKRSEVTVVTDKPVIEPPATKPVTIERQPDPIRMAAAQKPAQDAKPANDPLPESPEPEAKPPAAAKPSLTVLRDAIEAEQQANTKTEEPAPAPDPEPAPAEPSQEPAPAPEQAETQEPAPSPAPEEAAPAPEKKPVKPVKPVKSEALVPDLDEPERAKLPAGMDPMDQLVNIDFREMDLSQVVSLLAKKAGVNVIAGTEVVGTVTADMKNIPLRKAMDMVLRMNGLGIVEEEGIYRIVTYEEAVAARRATRMVPLKNAQADDVKTTLDGILVGSPEATTMAFSANTATNVIIISGPREKVDEYVQLASELDVKEPALPTVTEPIKLNYMEPKAAKPIAESMITKDTGKVEIDETGRNLIVTDIPVVVEQIREMITGIDRPVKQVAIDAMIVDAVLRDASQTGVNWLLEALRRHSTNGDLVSDVSQLDFESTLGNVGTELLDAGVLTLGILSNEVRLTSSIAAEVQSRNAEILANPSVVTVENQPAQISIVQEFPYQEITQGLTGPPVASTEFKPIGVTLEVTPRVTHDNSTIVNVQAKQSSVSGLTESGVPIEDKREASTTLRAQDGRTIFIGGLRNVSDRLSVSKVPVLGDIPVLNLAFRSRDLEKVNTELLIFLTCRVLGEELPELTPDQTENFNKLGGVPQVPDSQRAMFRDIAKPQEMRDPAWKWRRPK